MPGFKHYRDMLTWQLADQLETEVVDIMAESPRAMENLRFRSQIFDAATGVPSSVAEGFLRKSPGDFCRFIDYSLSSLGETELRLRTGIKHQYFTPARCEFAFELARRTHGALVGLKASQVRYLKEEKEKKRRNGRLRRRPQPVPNPNPPDEGTP